jgi:hypothetical protein
MQKLGRTDVQDETNLEKVMKTRLTIPMIAFALTLAGMSVRGHTGPTAASGAVTARNATNSQAAPVTRPLPPAHRPSLYTSGLSRSGALNLEPGEARTARSPNPQSWPLPCR